MAAYYPPVGFYFKLTFTGISADSDAGFQEVSGISAEMSVEEIGEGGENRFKHKVPNGAKFNNLVVKRGLVPSGSDLAQWCFDTIGTGLSAAIVPKSHSVILMNEEGNPLMTWNFVNAWPVKWSVSDLKSMEGEIVVESIEFAYSYFTIA